MSKNGKYFGPFSHKNVILRPNDILSKSVLETIKKPTSIAIDAADENMMPVMKSMKSDESESHNPAHIDYDDVNMKHEEAADSDEIDDMSADMNERTPLRKSQDGDIDDDNPFAENQHETTETDAKLHDGGRKKSSGPNFNISDP